jgi:hypothetical protein
LLVYDLVITPLIGQVTEAVASSPTAPLSGVHSEISALNEYAGELPATGRTVIETAVPTVDVVPLITASSAPAA